MVQIKVEKARIDQKQTPLLVIGVYENQNDFSYLSGINSALYSTIKEMILNKEFNANLGTSIVLSTMDKAPMKKIMLIGLGKKERFSNETARIVSAKAAIKLKEMGISEFSLILLSNIDEGLIEAICEGVGLSLYSFNW